MDAEHRVITELLALKDAPDDVLLDQVRAIGVPSTHHMLRNEAGRLRHADLPDGDGLCRLGRPHRRADPIGAIGIPGRDERRIEHPPPQHTRAPKTLLRRNFPGRGVVVRPYVWGT